MPSDGPRRSQVPPHLDLDDRGFQWERSGQELLMRRKVNAMSLLWPVLLAGGTLVAGASLIISDEWLWGSFLVFATVFPAAFLWARIVDRSQLVLGPDGLSWEQAKPRHFVGSWSGKDLEGVRIVLGEEPAGWGHRRMIRVQLRRRGAWSTLAAGNSLKRAERLAEAISETRGWPVGRHDEDRDGKLPRDET